ncbi:translocation and assembly module lipoprotein TamL [Pedobacter hartonius]|uniref:Outer membrane protein assembly factor BamA n=1 Tax=Pedobacter hartonius TaxID=425514 RepID=A0A1H3XIN6_9SPHI|nr:BamA/TamA family outer membrane protein [Pedobacter hartonius]SDZ98504.1 Outer membrane protein assembly factor BamA [Pedobacter hartonius]
MKAYSIYKNKFQFPAILLFIILFICACSSTKFIDDNQSIVKKVEIDSIPGRYKEEALNYIQKDIRPASRLGINVGLYNIFYSLFKTKSVGKPAPVLDSTLVEISRSQIEKFLISKGYFMAKVKSEIRVKKQRAQVDFKANTGPAFYVAKVNYTIPDSAVREIYMSRKGMFTHLHEGMQYDDDSLAYEREQIYEVMKENGYYDFSRPYVRFTVDSALRSSRTNVVLYIDDPDSSRHAKYKIGESNIVIAPTTEGFPDSVKLNPRIFRGIRYTDLSKRFRRNPVVRYDFIRQGETYDISKENLTYDRLYELNVFKNVKIEYVKSKDTANTLQPVIQLTPQKRMSNRIEGEVPFNAGTVGFTLSNTYTNNNIFRGAERFEFQIKGGLQARIGQGGSSFNDIYQRDFSLSANLAVPRLMVPFDIPMMGKNGMPSTIFSTSYVYSLQKDAFVRRVFLNSFTYQWVETKSKLHSFTPLNFEYRFGGLLIDSTTADGKQLISDNSYNILLLDRKDITLGMKYAYTLNANKLLLPGKSFVYFRGNIDIAGNGLAAVTKLTGGKHNPDAGDFATILGLPYNQYVRPEVDIRWYKNLGLERQFVARINGGVGVAYGNSTAIPFEKLFFAGGAGGVRAWQARTLGPGNYNRGDRVPTEEARRTLYGIDQLGQMHIEANLEYRYKLIDNFFGAKLRGAIFLDAGNVWNISSGNPQPETYFDFKNLGNQLGVGTGMGFRYDLQYFIFRFDIGLKLRDPQFDPADQWVIRKLFSGGSEFKEAYRLKNSPDDYHFFQYNFGIGLPF